MASVVTRIPGSPLTGRGPPLNHPASGHCFWEKGPPSDNPMWGHGWDDPILGPKLLAIGKVQNPANLGSGANPVA
jgi:hypothetical protein